MYSIVLILTLIIISGLIAYIGDLTGFRVGKKKITIFGLRPRRTAILIAILTGIIISILTITILSILSKDVRTALFGLEELRQKQGELTEEIITKNALLIETRQKLSEKTLELEELEKQYQQLNSQIESQTAQLESLREIGQELIIERDNLQEEIVELQEAVKVLYSGISWLRSGDIIIDQGEEIAMTIIKAETAEKEVEQSLFSLLSQATAKVIELGAAPDENSGQVLIISKKEFDDTMQNISQSKEELIVRLIAAMNVIEGEAVIANFSLLENKLVFHKNEVLLVEEIPVTKDPKEAENRLFALLRKVNLKAVQEGIIPEPRTSLVGTISAVNLFEMVQDVVQSDIAIQVKVTAFNDTWTTGPLKVIMEVSNQLTD